jgi:hypothetical protein
MSCARTTRSVLPCRISVGTCTVRATHQAEGQLPQLSHGRGLQAYPPTQLSTHHRVVEVQPGRCAGKELAQVRIAQCARLPIAQCARTPERPVSGHPEHRPSAWSPGAGPDAPDARERSE